MFAGVVRFDELKRGVIEHALRMTFKATRKEYIYPASHCASTDDNPYLPAMGQRFRLKKDVDTTGLTDVAMAYVRALQKYGAICADNGRAWDTGTTIDARLDFGKHLRPLERFKGSDFEVIVTTPRP